MGGRSKRAVLADCAWRLPVLEPDKPIGLRRAGHSKGDPTSIGEMAVNAGLLSEAGVGHMTAIMLLSSVVAPRLFGKPAGDPLKDAHDVLNAGWPRGGGKGPLRPTQGQLLIATPKRILTTVQSAQNIEVSKEKASDLLREFVLRHLDESTVIVMFSKTLTPVGSVFSTVDPRHAVVTMNREVSAI